MRIKTNKGFTLIELTIVMLLIGTMAAIIANKSNMNTILPNVLQAQVISIFGDVETNFNTYYSVNSAYPTGMTDTTFVPKFLQPPRVPTGFDATYGTNGINLAQQTGQPVNQNGYYISMKTTVNGADNIWNGIVLAGSKLPATKFFYNTTAPSLSNMAAPAGSTTVYITYWINLQ